MLQHIGYKLFFALCDLLLYPFVPLYYIGITGNVDIAIILVHSLLYVNWYTHFVLVMLLLFGYIPIGTMLPIH